VFRTTEATFDSARFSDLNILRLIKLFAWERKIYDRISEKRVEEVASVRKAYSLRVLNGLTK